MKKMTASEAQNSFGRLIKAARVEPVVIEKRGQDVAVALSVEEYHRLKGLDKKVTSSDAASHGERSEVW
ncbi:type II toxin-antitoxin system Phd/YefM family antitoxin [Thiolapillus sp.]